MSFSEIPNRRGLAVAIVSIVIALGAGHFMQVNHGQQSRDGKSISKTPEIPLPPTETMSPVVLLTPPAPSIPKTFG